MPICAPGVSQPKLGVLGAVTITGGTVARVLALSGLEIPAAAVGLIAAQIVLSAPVFCASDPPVDPHPTDQDLGDLLNVYNPVVNFPAVHKYADWFLSNYWYFICECSGAATPVAPPLSPPGSFSDSPRAPAANPPCFQNGHTDNYTGPITVLTQHDLTNSLLPTAGPSIPGVGLVVGNIAGVSAPVWPIPASVQGFDITATTLFRDPSETNPDHNTSALNTTDASGARIGSITLAQLTGPDVRSGHYQRGQTGVWPANATHYAITSAAAGAPVSAARTSSISYVTSGVCTGAQLEQECCPPDPSIDARLNQIIAYLQFLMSRGQPGVSTQWADATRHEPLSGAGHLDFTDKATAVRVEVSSIPPGVSSTPGDPLFYWDMGFITPLAIDIPLRGQRLVFNPEIFAMPAQATGVSWSLPAGAVISIVELVPA